MSLIVRIGASQGIDGREATLQAVHAAPDQLENAPVTLAIVLFSANFPPQVILGAGHSLLGRTPKDCSTILPLANLVYQPRSVVVALLSSSNFIAQSWFWGGTCAAVNNLLTQIDNHTGPINKRAGCF